MDPFNVLTENEFDLYVDEVGNLWSRAGNEKFLRNFGDVKIDPTKPLWVVMDLQAEVQAVIELWKLANRAVEESEVIRLC